MADEASAENAAERIATHDTTPVGQSPSRKRKLTSPIDSEPPKRVKADGDGQTSHLAMAHVNTDEQPQSDNAMDTASSRTQTANGAARANRIILPVRSRAKPAIETQSSHRPAAPHAPASPVSTTENAAPSARVRRPFNSHDGARRLFSGGINAILRQNRDDSVLQRRKEIEARQQEKLKVQAEEAARESQRIRQERRLQSERRLWDLERRAMHDFYDNLIETAHFLPGHRSDIRYRPYEYSPEERGTIDDQLQSAVRLRDEEEDRFERRYSDWRRANRGQALSGQMSQLHYLASAAAAKRAAEAWRKRAEHIECSR